MKCPRCGLTLPDNTDICPLCEISVTDGSSVNRKKNVTNNFSQDTSRFSSIDPNKESYDFDLQYNLIFKDAGRIKQSFVDMDLNAERPKDKIETFIATKEEKIVETPQRSAEDMEEAVQRAALRRERRNKKSRGKRVSRTERIKNAALKSAKEKRFTEKREKKNFLFGVIVSVLVVAIIIGTINFFAGMVDGDMHYPAFYTKDNQLFMTYDNKSYNISENFISSRAVSQKESNSKTTDIKLYKAEKPTSKQLIQVSNDGMYTFFLDNVDMSTGKGNLMFYQNDKKKDPVFVADSVYYKFKISNDGNSVLFLKNTDETGYHGELLYWNTDKKEPVSIDPNICSDNFIFTNDGQNALYIKNFNPIVNTGDLFVKGFNKDAIEKKIDEKVAFTFGATSGNSYVYAKNYDIKKGTYDLYTAKDNSAPVKQTEKSYSKPHILKMNDGIYAYSNYHDNYQSLSYIDCATGQINLMSDDITEVERISKDENSVIFRKTVENDKYDYYYIAKSENAAQKIANGVMMFKDDPQRKAQFDASDDFSRIAYIGGYDKEAGKGALYTLSIINGYAGTEKRISDIAYGCDVSSDGAVVRFAANYTKNEGEKEGVVDLIAYANSNIVTLSEDVSAGAFTYDKTGDVIVYAKNVNTTPIISGDIESVNSKGKVRKIEEAVNSYGLKNDNSIIMIKREGNATEGDLFISNEKGKDMKRIDSGVTEIVLYRYE